ncbi:MAG TPA: HTH domain-containing protein [Arthrobacter sp.]
MSENTHDAVRAIAAATGRQRENMIEDFFLDRQGLFNQIGFSLCRNFGVAPAQHGEDFASIVAREAWVMLSEQLADESQLDQVNIWEAMLKMRSKQMVRNFLDREMSPAAEMSSTWRRVRLLNQTRDEMRFELGREPTDDEIVETHNTKMRSNRSNPVKQGVIATADDLHVWRASADVDDHDRAETMLDADFVLHPVEGPKFIKLLVERTAEYNERLGEAAGLWLSGLYRTDGPPLIRTPEEIAEAMGVSRSTARSYIRKIKEYAVEVASEAFGITADDV